MRSRMPQAVNMTLNLAPMVDVMMCLIIFFLLGTRLVDEQHRWVDLAYAEAAREIERDELGSRVVVNVQPAPEDELAAKYVVHGWDGTSIQEFVFEPDELTRYLKRRAEQARSWDEQLRCVLRVDKRVPYRHVESVLRSCGLAQISRVVFSANAGQDPEATQ